MLAGGVTSLNYTMLSQLYGGYPVAVAYGKSETGKTTALKVVLSIFVKESHTYKFCLTS